MLMDIIHGDFYRDPALFQMRAQSLGFDLTVPHQGLWLRARPKPGVPEEKLTRIHNRKWMECADAVLSHYFKKPYLKCNSAPDSMFLIPKTYITPDSIGRQIIEACEKEDKEELFEFWLGIGTLYSELESFTETMQEAQQVVEVLTLLGQSNTYRQADDILLSMLVRQERENPMFRKVFANNIQPLLEMDVSEKNDLLRTLGAYFECGENISQAADALYVHRNTMRSRLENISELTGRNLKDPLDCLELQLALHYYRINIKTAGLTD
jgi:sugar diacid utilization regulator